jgi:Fe-S oxidoreductase
MATIDDCNLCGRCNAVCAIYRMTRKERLSNRHKAFLVQKKVQNADAFLVLLDGTVEQACPAGIDVDEDVVRYRAFLIDHGIETEANKHMISNIRKYGNPYGKVKS